MKRKYFGTDGIRGAVGKDPITPELILKLGWAVGQVLGQLDDTPGKVLIGKDTRVSGYMMESALESGLSAAGIDVSLLGPMTTPGIAYLTRTARARAGIMISASHNLYEDNGIKFFSADGTKLDDAVEMEIEAAMQRPLKTVKSNALGKAMRYSDAPGRYIEFCKSTFPTKLSLEGMKIIVDCAHGAAYQIAPHVFSELGADVVAIGNQPDGFNINKDCGSTHPEFLKQAVLENKADLGIALDGDGDRVILVDSAGNIVNGDQILFIICSTRQAQGRLSGGIVGTLMTNLGLEQACTSRKIPFKRAAVGDRYVMSMLLEQGWELGGESSGHIICLDKATTGDGIVSALQVLAEIIQSGRTLEALTAGMETFPQTMINVRTDKKFDINGSDQVQAAVQAAESELADKGRILLRASGTEPVIRVMVEGQDLDQVNRLSHELAKVVEQAARDQ